MKRFLSFLLCLTFLSPGATILVQGPVRHAAAGGSNLLLDESGLSGATGAWSVRKLRSAYSGSCLRVRRSSDNTEQDIGFSGNDLDTSALTTFCGAGNGFVVTWYGQIGTINLTQATQANQPQIVASGSVITGANSKPALDFDGTADVLAQSSGTLDSFIAAGTMTCWAVFNADAIATDAGNAWFNDGIFTDSGAFMGINLQQTNGILGWNYDGTGDVTINAITTGNWNLVEMRHGAGNLSTNKNGGSDNTVASGNTQSMTGTVTVGRNHATSFFNGKMHEFVIYDTELASGDRSTGRSNINTYYVIY